MELKSFVAAALSQIIDGVKEAQAHAKRAGGVVNPSLASAATPELMKRNFFPAQGGVAQFVEFDVAVTTAEGTATKAGMGIFVAAIGLGTSGQSEAQNATTSRVKFAVPVAFPSG